MEHSADPFGTTGRLLRGIGRSVAARNREVPMPLVSGSGEHETAPFETALRLEMILPPAREGYARTINL